MVSSAATRRRACPAGSRGRTGPAAPWPPVILIGYFRALHDRSAGIALTALAADHPFRQRGTICGGSAGAAAVAVCRLLERVGGLQGSPDRAGGGDGRHLWLT